MRKVLLVFFLLSQLTWALDRQPNSDFRIRRQAVASKANGGAVLLFASNEAEGPNDLYGYRPDDNFFYLSGWSEPGAALLIVGGASAAITPTPKSSFSPITILRRKSGPDRNWARTALTPARSPGSTTSKFSTTCAPSLVRLLPLKRAVVFTDIVAGDEVSNSAVPLDWLKRANAFPVGVSFQDVRPMLASLRTYKDSGEIERIRHATDASIAAHFAAMHAVKPGITEREISALMQYEWGKRGCERPAYAPIVGSGFDSTVLHYSEDSGTMQSGDLVVIDAAGEYSMYASDITRTLPVSGKFTARQREIYDIVLGAQQAAAAAFRSGKSYLRRDRPDSLHDVAYNYINTHGKDLHGEPLGKYFIHGLGHYVGLNVHDPGDYDAPLGPGAVFTLEPGIYIPEEKLGVRIEDILYVDPDGKLINLTGNLPHTADEVEHAMAGK